MLRIALVLLALAAPVPSPAAGAAITPEVLAAEIVSEQAPLVLDVRTQAEFDAGHVPGAVLIPHDQLESRLSELGAPGDIVVYCRSGRRSALVEPLLEKHGFRVQQLAGSWQAWEAAGLPEQINDDLVIPESK
ncbi:MAG TPA: rhodanese-like domain-containing protein [Arenimonas sp.]|uniref:rhodanese-like domain-containing protein n=1 Tax=Arenimonas sp. TaxID=1872635 RepID=UPI002D1BF7E7|nr:rhodanese-like domain-containing protein [Arenimonas sp.]HMB58200.1 rhodanese-like domain-containing protein [Arenimonas sp.]